MRLFVNPGMMWPVRAATVGMPGMASWAEAEEERCSPVAVRMLVRGAEGSMWSNGAEDVK